MPTYLSGIVNTQKVGEGNRKYDVSDQLWEIDPEYGILAFLARKIKKKATTDPEFRHFERENPSRYSTTSASVNNSATTIPLAAGTGTRFRTDDIVLNIRTGEQMRVTAVSGDSLTVVRAYGVTAAAAMNSGDTLVMLGCASPEAAKAREAVSLIPEKKYGYTQIFREPYGVTGTEESTETFSGGTDLPALRRYHLQIHLNDIERAFLFSEPKEDLTGSTPIRTTGSLRSSIVTNVDSQATLTEPIFEAHLAKVFSKSTSKKFGLYSPLIASAINSWAKDGLQMFPKDKTYGIEIVNYTSIHGQIAFAVERLLAENTTWAGYGFTIDLEHVVYRYLAGNGKSRDTAPRKIIPSDGEDAVREEFLSEVGLQVIAENRSGIIKGVTSYA